MQSARVSVAEIAKQIHAPLAVLEEFPIHLACVKAGHRAAVQSQGPRSKYEVGSLERTVAERRLVSQRLIAQNAYLCAESAVEASRKIPYPRR